MEIKIGLKELWAGFQESASDENLNDASRKLAARMCVVVAHISRVEGLVRSVNEAVNKRVMEVLDTRFAKFMEELGAELTGVTGAPADAPAEGETPPVESPAADAKPAAKPPVTTTPPAPMPPRGKMRSVKPAAKVEPPDEETQMSVDSMLADADAEVRAIENAGKAPLRTVPTPAGGGGNAS